MKRFTPLLGLLALLALLPGAAQAVNFSVSTVAGGAGAYNSLSIDLLNTKRLVTYDSVNGRLLYWVQPDLFGWSFEVVDGGPGNDVGQYCSLAVDANGDPHIGYYDATHDALKYAHQANGLWTIEVVDTPGAGQNASIALDSAGNPYIVYTKVGQGVVVAHRIGGVWTRASISPGVPDDIAIDRFDRPQVVLHTVNPTQAVLVYAVLSLGIWNLENFETIPYSGGFSGAVSLDLDVNGDPHVSYAAACGLRYAHRSPQGAWHIENVDSASGMVKATSLELDRDGSPRIAYQVDPLSACGWTIGTPGDLYFTYKALGLWVRQSVDAGSPISGVSPSLALDAFSNPTIAFGQGANLALAAGKLVHLWYTSPNAVKPGGTAKILAWGSGMDVGQPSVAQLQGPALLNAVASAGVLDSHYVELTFDFSSAPTGVYTLIVANSAGADTLPNALVVYNDVADLGRLTVTGAADFSPDVTEIGAQRLAFVSDREGEQDLFVRDLDNDDFSAYRLTQSGSPVSPSWNPAGTQIVYQDLSFDRLYVADAVAGGILAPPPQLGTGGPGRNPSWSPTSDLIAYDDGVQIKGIHYPSEFVEPFALLGTDPDWSPNGQSLVYVVGEGSGNAIKTQQVLPSPGIATVIVPSNGFENVDPAWSPDGNWIAFSSNRGSGTDFDIWIVSAGGGTPIAITTTPEANEGHPVWTQGGQSLAFTSNVAGNLDIVEAVHVLLPSADSDGDGIPDSSDLCPNQAPLLGQIDQNHDGCADLGSSFRFTRYWSLDRFPITIENNATGDPSIGDGSEFTQYSLAIGAWQASGPAIQVNVVSGGLDNAVSGDGRNSVTYTDQDGFILGTVAITYSTVADDDTTIGGRLYHKNEVIDSDILFNTQNYAFSTPSHAGPTGAFSLRNVATHELGHFFGFGHSTLQKSTMFYVAYRDTNQTSLEADDRVLAANGYHGPSPAPVLSIEGKVLRGEDGITPVPGAALFAIAAGNDTVQMTVSGVDGTYRFFNLTQNVHVYVAPLDGSGAVNGLTPSGISVALNTVAETDFLPEFYDGATETNADFGTTGVAISSYPLMNANIITNPDLTGPVVLSTSPSNGATNVPATTTIVVGFDERIDVASVSGQLHLENETTHTGVGGAAAFLTPSNLLVFTPSAPLDFSTLYTMTVRPGITDLNGNPLADTLSFQFTIQAQPPLVVSGAAPAEVPIGGTLVLSGTGFSPIAGNNQVNFTGGTSAVPYASTLEQLFVSVPPGTQSGNLNVVVGAQSSNDFPIVIVPPQAPPIGVFLGSGNLAGDPRKVTLVPSGAYAYVATSAGVTAMNALPSSANFLQVTQIPVAGGTVGIAAHPDGQRVLAITSNPPALRVIDASPQSAFFNTVVQTVTLPEEPLGMAMNPGGSSAFIVYANRVVTVSMASGSSFGLETREWSQVGVSFLGDVSVSPDAAQAYASASGGNVAVLGLAGGEGVVDLLSAGITPRETAGTPLANAFYSVDESGTLRRFGARGPLQGSISVGGSYNGLAMSPDGSFAYALNFTMNRVDVMDAFAQTPVLVTSFGTGVDPVDLAVGSGGRYFYVAGDGSNVLQVYDAQSGVLVSSVFPRSGNDQTIITVSGSGFSSTPSQNLVQIGNTSTTVLSASPTALTVVQNGLVSGPLRVTTGAQVSNPITYKGVDLDETPFIGLGALNDTDIPETARLLETPDGRWLIGLGNDGSMQVIQADPSQPNFLRPVQVLSSAETQLATSGAMAITPDGHKLYVAEPEASSTAVFALSSSSTNPLARVGTISQGGMALAGEFLATTPDGARLLILSDLDDVVYEVATRNDSLMNTGPGDAIGGTLNNPSGLAVDPRGTRLYLGDSINGSVSVGVFDLERTSATYRQLVTTFNVATGSGPYQIVASPRGDFLYCATLQTLAVTTQNNLSAVDIRPGSLTYGQALVTQPIGLNGGSFVLPNHSGNIVFVLNNAAAGSLEAFSGDGTLNPLTTGPSSARLSGRISLVGSLDDARLYVPALGGGIYVTDVSGVQAVHVISGDQQVGVANQPLPAPMVVNAEKVGGAPAEGAVFVYDGLNGNFGSGVATAITAANGQGFAQASYVAGAAGLDRVDALSAAGTLQFFLDVVGDTTAAPPQLLTVTPGPNDHPGNLTNVAVDFSKAIVPATVAPNTLTLQPQGGSALAGTYSFADQGRRVVFDPAAPLNFNTTYEIVVAAALQDYDGHPLANPGTFTFTTGAPPALSLAAVNAVAALPGNVIVLSGSGFASTPAENTVLFGGGVAVTPTQGDPGALSAVVPSNAVSGPVRVVVGPDSSNTLPFTVLGQTTPLNEPLNVISVPASGQSIAVLPNGTRAYMTSPSSNAVVPILIATGAAENPIAVGQLPFGVAPAPNSALTYVSNFLSNTISVIGTDPSAPGFHTVVHTIPTGHNPSGLVVNPDGRTLYVCNYGDATLSFIDIDPSSATYNSAKSTITVGSSSKTVGVSPDGTTLIVGNATEVLLIDTATGGAKSTITVGSSSKSVGVSPDGAFAVVLLDNGELVLLDIRDGVPDDERAKSTITVGSSSKSVGVSPDGGSVYVTKSDGTVDVYAIVALGGSAAVAEPITSQYQLVFVTSIQVGENPDGLAFDKTTGLLLVVNSGDNTVSFINTSGTTAGAVTTLCDIDPNTINPTTKGKYISAYLQFPVFLDPHDVILSTVRFNALNGSVAAETTLSALLDRNGDGILEFQARFDRTAVQNLIPVGNPVLVSVTGQIDGRTFAGYDSVKVLRPKIKNPHAAQIVPQLSDLDIQWSPIGGGQRYKMDIYWSRDNGETWQTVVMGTPDDSSYVWTVPDVTSSRECFIQLVAKNKKNEVTGVEIMADPFTISSAPLGIDELPVRFALLPAAPNPFTALGTRIRFDLPEPVNVTLRVYGVDGGIVRTLAEHAAYPAGRHAVTWDGRNEQGLPIRGGVYFIKIQAGKKDAVQKVVRVTR